MSPPINIDGSTVDAITIDGDSVSEVTVDGSAVFNAIPDSVGNPDYRWIYDENSGPFVDEVGGVQATNNGTTQVTNTKYVGDAARKGDGSDAYIDLGTLNTFGSNIPSPLTVAMVFDDYTQSSASMFSVAQSDNQSFVIGFQTGITNNSDEINFGITDTNSNDAMVTTDFSSGNHPNDGNLHTIVCRKSSGVAASDLDIVIDADTSTPTTNTATQSPNSNDFNDFSDSILTHILNDNRFGSGFRDATSGVLNDIHIDIGNRWTDTQVNTYHNDRV